MAGAKRLGIFGGAFDPPHLTHAALVNLAVTQLQLDQMVVIPTGQAWHKTRALSLSSDRLAMTGLAFSGMPNVRVDDREIRREGPSYTVDTLLEIRQENPGAELFLLIGGDQAQALSSWHRWQEIVQIATICVADRIDVARADARFLPPTVVKSQFLRLEMPPSDISATEIRARIAKHEDISPLVGGRVARYIAQHHLYLHD